MDCSEYTKMLLLSCTDLMQLLRKQAMPLYIILSCRVRKMPQSFFGLRFNLSNKRILSEILNGFVFTLFQQKERFYLNGTFLSLHKLHKFRIGIPHNCCIVGSLSFGSHPAHSREAIMSSGIYFIGRFH